MTADNDELADDLPSRFNLALFIVHPTLNPADITAQTGLLPSIVHPIGEQRATSVGSLLPGKYKDTRWRHCIRYEVIGQWFVPELNAFLESLSKSAQFFEQIKLTGGSVCLVAQFLGDGYFGDTLPVATLAKIANLHLDFGIEVFSTPQR